MVQRNCTGTQYQKDREILDIFVSKSIDEQCWVGERGILVCMHSTGQMLLHDVLIFVKFFSLFIIFIIDKNKRSTFFLNPYIYIKLSLFQFLSARTVLSDTKWNVAIPTVISFRIKILFIR